MIDKEENDVNYWLDRISFALRETTYVHKFKMIREKIANLENENEDWKADHEHNLELMQGLNKRIAELKKENMIKKEIIIGQQQEINELKTVCDFNCPVHKLATHNACLTCTAVRNSPHHDLKNVTDEELQKIIKDAEAEMEM